MRFRLADVTVHWTGVDDTTPAGHCLVDGTDPLGRRNLFLFAGTTPSDEAYRGRVQLPAVGLSATAIAYKAQGGFAGSGNDTSALLARLVDPFEGHFVHCYIREGAHCSCGATTALGYPQPATNDTEECPR